MSLSDYLGKVIIHNATREPYHVLEVSETRDANGNIEGVLTIRGTHSNVMKINDNDLYRLFMYEEPAIDKECPTCEGAGMEVALRPNGHTEINCLDCHGTGINPDFEDFTIGADGAEISLKCECGIEKIGGGIHSDWCAKYKKAV